MSDRPPRAEAVPLEREVKLAAAPDFSVAGLDGASPGLVATPSAAVVLDARYWDTGDLRLIRSGVTLRHRTTDGADGVWTVKVPAGGRPGAGPGDGVAAGAGSSAALVRTEVDLPDDAHEPAGVHGGAGDVERRPPLQAARLVAAHARDAELVPVARLRTTRTRLALADGSGEIGELADDLVEVFDADGDGEHPAMRFRELEVEVGDAVPAAVLDAIVGHLRDAGAGAPERTPKLARALGPRALAPPDLLVVPVGPGATAGEALRAGIAEAVVRLVAAHHVVCASGAVDQVRAVRVSARRARTVLRIGREHIDADWGAATRAELRRVGDALRPLRDHDSLAARVSIASRSLDREGDRRQAAVLRAELAAGRDALLQPVLDVLAAPSYRGVLAQLHLGASALPTTERADASLSDAAAALVRPQWRRADRAVHSLERTAGASSALDAERAVRRAARRARVAAELAEPAVGGGARRLASALGDVSDALGVRHDALVAAAWLREAAEELPPAEAFVAGQLVAHELAAAERAGARWRRAWGRANHPKALRWL